MFHFLIFLSLSTLIQAHAHPIDWLMKFSSSARDENGWMWGWAWASDGSVSIVDRSPAVNFPARPASFGAELKDPLLGYAIPLSAFTAPCPQNHTNHTNHTYLHSPFVPNPIQGCPHLCINGTRQPDPSESWIAIVQRGGCPFVEKARQAQQLGARAIVVGGDQDNPDALLNMYSERDASDVTIAATYIKYWDYVQLLQFIEKSNTSHSGLQTLSLLLQTEYAAWEWYSPIVTFIIILLLPSLLTFVTLLIHRVRAARAAQRDRAPEEVVHRLPWRVWTGNGWEKHEPEYPLEGPLISGTDLEQGVTELDAVGDNHPSTSHEPEHELPSWVDEQQECAICLENFAKGDRVRVLPCHHMFHLDEVDEWLISKKKLCPVCKADVTQPHHDPAVHPHQPDSDTIAVALDQVPSQDPTPTSVATTILATERTPLLEDSHEETTVTS